MMYQNQSQTTTSLDWNSPTANYVVAMDWGDHWSSRTDWRSFDDWAKKQGKPDRFWVRAKRINERKLAGGWRC
jgi:hypothetical protein